jgi:hypothetical protein
VIAYLKAQDTTVEVPDDITESELADVSKNFSAYFPTAEQGIPDRPLAPAKPFDASKPISLGPVEGTTPTPRKFVPNFFEANIKPFLNLAIYSGQPLNLKPPLGRSPEERAFAGKALESFTFGVIKPDQEVQEAAKNHPIMGVAGELAGGLGSLLTTGGLLRIAGLGAKATQIGQTGAKVVASAPRFIPPAIMTGATFGTQTFIKRTVKAMQDGGVDIADFGYSVIKDTALGGVLGSISGVANAMVAVPSAAGLGFISAKMEGADNVEALLSMGLWGAFELVGSFGRTPRLRLAGINSVKSSVAENLNARAPGQFGTEGAKVVADNIVENEIRKIGFKNAEDLAKSGPENTLQLIENINQKVRRSIVPAVEPPISPAKPAELTLEGQRPAEGVVIPKPPEMPTTGQIPEPRTPPVEVVKAKLVKMDKSGIPIRKPSSIVSTVTLVDGKTAKITHQMILDEAQGIYEQEKFIAELGKDDPLAQFVVDNGGLKGFKADEVGKIPEAEEMRGVPLRFKNNVVGLPVDEMAQMAFDANLIEEPSGDLLREKLKSIPAKGEKLRLADFYDQGQHNLEELFSTIPTEAPEPLEIPIKPGLYAGEAPLEVAPGVFFEKEAPKGELFKGTKENLSDRYNRLRKQALEQGMNLVQASKYAKDQMRIPVEPTGAPPKPKQAEFATLGGVEGFGQGREGEPELFDKGKTEGRQFGEEGDQVAQLKKSLGGLEQIQKMEGPELVKLAQAISGNVPIIKKFTRSLGLFSSVGKRIALNPAIFKDQKLWEAVLAHEIGHAMDFEPDETLARGNVLGRIATLRQYRKSLLPEGPESIEQILTPKDRQRLRAQAEKVAKGKFEEGPDRAFAPEAILNIWNSVSVDYDPDLLDYIKGIGVEDKKFLIKSAMAAYKNGGQVTVHDINKFNSLFSRGGEKKFKTVADIYRDLLKKEIKKRKLWEDEVIREELKNLTQYWKPFSPQTNPNYTDYRFSSPELYADFVSVLLNAPGKVKQIAPNTYQAFFNYLQNKPEVMKNLLEIQAITQSDDTDLQKVRGEDILDMFIRGDQAFLERQANLESAKKSIWDKLRVFFWDKNSILLDENDKLRKGEKLSPATDAQYAIEKNSLMGNFVKSFLEDLDRLVYKPARDAGLLNEVKTVLFLDRVGADRGELANPLGHTPASAKSFLDNMEKQDPEKFRKVSELAQIARTWFRDLSNIPGAEDFFTPEQIFTMGLNDKYAPFRVVDYMKDYISAGFANQMGTFKDIGDPLTSLAMKGVSLSTAIERNRLKKIVGQMLLRSGIEMKKAEITQYPGHFKIQDPTENYLGIFTWKENGKWVAYHLDKYISDLFNTEGTEKIGQLAGVFNLIFQNNFFRGLWITFNPGFQVVNLWRDFMRTWKTTPGLTFGNTLRLYWNSIPESRARAKGIFNPLIQQMERAGALQLTLNDLIIGQTSEDRELESVFQKYDIIESHENKYKGIPIIEQITKILEGLRYLGDAIETLPKVVGWKALDNMAEEERAYFVRNLVGTPNPRRAGTGAPLMNSIFLFSNIFKEGFRGLIEAGFTNPKTRKSYWTKTFVSAILPKIIQGMAMAGFFGIGIKKAYDKMTEYHKTNYIPIPLGVDEKGNAVYLTLPQDEDARLIGGIFWKAINHQGSLIKNLTDILSFGADQFPGVAPAIKISKAWSEFISGENPRDTFHQQDILTDQEKVAGGLYAFEPMARWTLNETGLIRLDIRDRLKDEPIYKTAITSIPILNRFIRITKGGEREIAKQAGKEVAKTEARQGIDIKDQAREAIRKGISIEDFTSKAETGDELRDLRTAYKNQMKGFTQDPFVQALNSATSSDQKLAILKKVKEGYSDMNEFNDYLDSLRLNKIISSRTSMEARD